MSCCIRWRDTPSIFATCVVEIKIINAPPSLNCPWPPRERQECAGAPHAETARPAGLCESQRGLVSFVTPSRGGLRHFANRYDLNGSVCRGVQIEQRDSAQFEDKRIKSDDDSAVSEVELRNDARDLV